MITTENPKRLKAQTCPLCNSEQDIIIHGWEPEGDDPKNLKINNDKGYSFCNCSDIFFTDWANMKQGVYDPDYYKKYDNDHCNKLYRQTVSKFMPTIMNNISRETTKRVLEIGAINPSTLDVFKLLGFETTGLDICEHPLGNHQLIVSDFEKLLPTTNKFDVIWASHIFEHFQDPIQAINHANSLLNEGGLLCVSMPDPWFIDFSVPYQWGHWHLQEHHILWDMESFGEALRQRGFKLIEMKRNATTEQICNCDFTVIGQKLYDVSDYSRS